MASSGVDGSAAAAVSRTGEAFDIEAENTRQQRCRLRGPVASLTCVLWSPLAAMAQTAAASVSCLGQVVQVEMVLWFCSCGWRVGCLIQQRITCLWV